MIASTAERREQGQETALEGRIVSTVVELESLAGSWRELWNSNPNREIFQHFDFIREWIRAFGEGEGLLTPVVRARGNVIAILPLVKQGRSVRFIGHSVSDYNDVLCAPEVANAALDTAFSTLLNVRPGAWDTIILERVREDSQLARYIREAPQWRKLIQYSAPTPCPILTLNEEKQALLDGILGKDKVKKTSKTIQRLGDISFRHIESAAEIREHLAAFAEQHISRSFLEGRRSGFLRSDYRAFYQNLVEALDVSEELRFSVLEVNGNAAAYHFGFDLGQKYLFYKPTFDIDLWDYSPGQVLLFKLLEWCRTSDTRAFDFGEGPETYKYRYANATRNNVTITLYRPDAMGRARRAVMQWLAHARTHARQIMLDRHPKLAEWCERGMGSAKAWPKSRIQPFHDQKTAVRLNAEPLPTGDRFLKRVSLRELSCDAAVGGARLTPRDLQSIRERMKKGCALYADGARRYVVLGAIVEGDPAETGNRRMVFTILQEVGSQRSRLVRELARIAEEEQMPGWLSGERKNA
jgi:CelD/BcsL family acetyltransferase involved in cellulose biosynthesis